ncbi:hypothetical protein N7466_001360 [Penicillium verhagenii]|uniref:uncharacterized protein n=1 Tax=Penicillium verhagenii TaxID=1562060 RepID=UPI0025451AAE|nr:uncharacterized protein N7466_001360 [Penicillium verhagenii]KAJ5948345.1 hypothetical protein N7466_001360 [Penicillium verhagenii]
MATLRKNGLQSSCEPCRKSKIRCDHEFPICGRCARMNKSNQCLYRRSPTRTVTGSVTANSTPTQPQRHDASWERTSESSPVHKRRRLSQSEYLGMTSHFALFQESTDNLAISLPQGVQEARSNTHGSIPNTIPIESEAVRRGAHILQLLRNLPVYQRIAESSVRTTQESGFLSKQLVELTFKSLQEFSGPESPSDSSSLFARSRQIFGLFSAPIPIHSSLTLNEFMSSMSCRWEIIGLAFSCLGVGTALPCDWDAIFQIEGKPVDSRNDLAELALSATETCLSFCNEAGVLNDAVSWLISQYLFLTTLVHGDRDYRSWRALGDLSTIIFSLGLNQPPPDQNTPFWLLETRKRLMGSAFSSDKQLATFLGRPPRISWRFCDIALPLDLSFAEIIAEPEVRDRAISRLDTDGWNTEESDTQAVWLRVSLIMGPVRESILELSLNQQGDNLPGRIEELLQQSHEAWSGLPSFLHQTQDEILDFKHSIFLQLHLDYLYDQFLLFRILSKRQNTWAPELVKVSHEILSEVLLLVDGRIRTMRLTPELSWVISFFGLPSAGVLSIELVRRASHQSTDSSSSPSIAVPSFSRSRVIQDLSIFASYLRSIVQSHEGNYDICRQAQETIGRVLDFVLSSEAVQPAVPLDIHNMVSNPDSPDTTDMATILDYNYCITNLDNWQFELQDTLHMF